MLEASALRCTENFRLMRALNFRVTAQADLHVRDVSMSELRTRRADHSSESTDNPSHLEWIRLCGAAARGSAGHRHEPDRPHQRTVERSLERSLAGAA